MSNKFRGLFSDEIYLELCFELYLFYFFFKLSMLEAHVQSCQSCKQYTNSLSH